MFHVNLEKSSSTAVYEYFSAKLSKTGFDNVSVSSSKSYFSHISYSGVSDVVWFIMDVTYAEIYVCL